MPLSLYGIGLAVPPLRIERKEAAEIAWRLSGDDEARRRTFDAIYGRSGVDSRHSVLLQTQDGDFSQRQSFFGVEPPGTRDRMTKYEEEAPDLAYSAARFALDEARTDPSRITHLVTVSCTGFRSPGFDLALMDRLPLPRSTERTHVGFMGCHGLLNGLRVARAFTAADPSARVLLCSVELCSLHLQYGWNAERVVANALFADGAAALVAGGSETGRGDALRVVSTGSVVIPETDDAMSWAIGDQGFEMTLSARVPELIAEHVRPWLEDWLAKSGHTVDSIGSWAVHPGGPRILSTFAESIGLQRGALDASFGVLREYGNMSSATVLFILDRLRRAGAPRPIVMIAFGPGLTVEAALLI